jgi:hypothetical protein
MEIKFVECISTLISDVFQGSQKKTILYTDISEKKLSDKICDFTSYGIFTITLSASKWQKSEAEAKKANWCFFLRVYPADWCVYVRPMRAGINTRETRVSEIIFQRGCLRRRANILPAAPRRRPIALHSQHSSATHTAAVLLEIDVGRTQAGGDGIIAAQSNDKSAASICHCYMGN